MANYRQYPGNKPEVDEITVELTNPFYIMYRGKIRRVSKIVSKEEPVFIKREGQWLMAVENKYANQFFPVNVTDNEVTAIRLNYKRQTLAEKKWLREKFEAVSSRYGIKKALEYMEHIGYGTDF